ncbi:MAG: metal-dependent transcriptional regulator [Natronomonas sp.]|jgi:DtxR family Mn-dependent transcriptional regulator|uniref:Metal-dependent transcriptional regulator n=1 Tax=Natronomonas salsuginis TaxID=2217661 RepID=A0A4U5JE91_9EURY|nr:MULTISPECIES: metal-dependent transcriptional regulator [Natronomonas]MDR9382196.1 metal-dependent transcriptional regulator [Natronomonas sp.]MDR9430560.1 metal-dependent transcriptional regulator [Natronomonas sp.]TKR27662.1 metal-dependent transcriptional regulator [Natronomonas salsuginis]
MLSAVMEDYIKAIYAIGNDTGERVGTSELAEYLDVTSPTVSSMLKKLEERGLVDREEYRGVRLTEEGEIVALEILRHHRLLESFLTDHLDYDWADVHEEADRLEHHVSEELTARIADALDNPGVDPHGDPIPDADLKLPDERGRSRLSDASEGDRAIVRRIRHQGDEELRYLSDAGIEPGTEVEVLEVAPFGLVTVRTLNGDQSLPKEIARLIETTPATEAEA